MQQNIDKFTCVYNAKFSIYSCQMFLAAIAVGLLFWIAESDSIQFNSMLYFRLNVFTHYCSIVIIQSEHFNYYER